MNRPLPQQLNVQFGRAWFALAAALALHVADEAHSGFLAVYNPAVRSIRATLHWLPIPTFTFWPWLIGLVVGITLLFALTPAAYGGNRILVWIGVPFSALMILNALGHFGGSFYLGHAMPGVLSSPVLIMAAILCLVRAVRVATSERRPE